MLVIVILLFIVVLLSVALTYSVRRNLEFNERFEDLGDQVDESLDIIDGCYRRISAVSEIPVLSDDPTIRQLVSDIQYTKHAILLIANKVVIFDNEDEGNE